MKISNFFAQSKQLGEQMWHFGFGTWVYNPMNAVAHSHEEYKSLKRRGIEPIDFETARTLSQLSFHLRPLF
jgi:hypothetical protein